MRKATVTYSIQGEGSVPMIRLRGKWLEVAGFQEGTPVQVEVRTGRITLIAEEGAATYKKAIC